MGKNLGGAVIDLLDSERVELRLAAATVLSAVGKGDKSVEAALTVRLADSDGGVRKIALEGLAEFGASGIATKLVPLLRGNDEGLAERAAQVLAQQGAAAEATLRKEVAAGPVQARRVMAQLLLRRGTQPSVEAVLDQLPDTEFGEQALQLLRTEIDAGNEKSRPREKLASGADRQQELSRSGRKPRNREEDKQRTVSNATRRCATGVRGAASSAACALIGSSAAVVASAPPQVGRIAGETARRFRRPAPIVAQSEAKGTDESSSR